MIFFGGALAGDTTRIISESRTTSNTVEAAAVAGASQFQPNSIRLDESKARAAVQDLLTEAGNNGTLPKDNVESLDVQISDNAYGSQRVTVTVGYRIEELVFSQVLGVFVEGEPSYGNDFSVSRSADVCVPGQYAPTTGSCVRPTRR